MPLALHDGKNRVAGLCSLQGHRNPSREVDAIRQLLCLSSCDHGEAHQRQISAGRLSPSETGPPRALEREDRGAKP